MKLFVILVIAVLSWWIIDLDYDSEDPNSIEKMMKWSPLSAVNLLKDIETASDPNDPYLRKLDGLNADEIHDIAVERRIRFYEREIPALTTIIEDLKKTGKPSITTTDQSGWASTISLEQLEKTLIEYTEALNTAKAN